MMEPQDKHEQAFIESALFNHGLESTEYRTHNVPWKKQYEIWRHGDGLISGSQSQQDPQVAVIQLQRAVEQRDTILQALYRFTDIPYFPRCSQYVIMADLGIIRPALKKPLRALRNVIVHEVGDIAVDKSHCEYLFDTAWYYLKATDRLAQQCASDLHVTCGEDDPHWTHLKMTFKPNSWTVNIVGDIPDRHLLSSKSPDCLSVKIATSHFEVYRGVSHFKFSGEITGSETLFRNLVQAFFEESVL